MIKLGVNIDHVATLRQARGGFEPEPVTAAMLAESAGADGIVAHLREDRRHIKESDLYLLKQAIKTKLNLEMSVAADIVEIACCLKPDQATIVPEKRKELTTEGGLDVVSYSKAIKKVAEKLKKNGVTVSLFIDPDKRQIDATKKIGVGMIELHTGRFSNAVSPKQQEKYLRQLKDAIVYALRKELIVNAGHGLNYSNVTRISSIKGIAELNIGHSIISRAVFAGITQAVREMKALIN